MVNYRVVAIGTQGAGKTSFFNKICYTQEKVSGGLKSCTELITSANSKFGEAFTMVDTPGISFTKNIFENTISIVAALTDGDIHKILLVIRYNYRTDSIFDQIKSIIALVAKHKPLLGVVITHFDQCEVNLQQEYQTEVRELIKNYYGIDLVLFSGSKTPAQELCLDILNSLDRQGKKLVISENRFNEMLRTFKFTEELDVGKKAFTTKLEQFAITIKKYIQDFNTNMDNSDQILHALLIFIRKEQKVMMENFENQYGKIMYELYEQSNNPLQSYYCHYVIKFHLKQQIQQLIDEINKKMVYPEDHPYRSLRRCPYCRTIWFKVIGCDDTHCGNRVYESDEELIRLSMPTYYEYKFYYLNKDVIDFKHIQQKNDQMYNDDELDNNDHTNSYLDSQVHPNFQEDQSIIIQKDLPNQQNINIQEDILITKYPLDGSQLMEFSTYHKVDNFPDNLKQKWEEITNLQQTQSQNLRKTNRLLETVQINQIKVQQQIGCGESFNWEEAEFVDLEELKLNHAPIMGIFSDKDELYQREFNYMKGSLIEKAKQLQKIIQN